MESVLFGPTHEACVDFLNDIVIGRIFQEQLDKLWKVFQGFRRALLYLNPEKCQLLEKEVWYMGHIVSPEGATEDQEKLEPEQRWP
jgi:hypothetical protein